MPQSKAGFSAGSEKAVRFIYTMLYEIVDERYTVYFPVVKAIGETPPLVEGGLGGSRAG